MNLCVPAQQSIDTWIEQHPQTITFLNELNTRGTPWGIYCGAAVEMLANGRQTRDFDIIIRKEDFETIAELAPTTAAINNNQQATVTCGDGVVLDFPERSICFELDDTEIEVMASGSAMYEGHQYQLELTDLAIQNRLYYENDKTALYFSHPFDTIALKLILQRDGEQEKCDSKDIASLSSLFPTKNDYATRRAAEVGLDRRAWGYLQTSVA